MKIFKQIILYAIGASLVFYVFMEIGHYSGKQKLESQYPLVSALTGAPSTWTADEKSVMAVVLLKCKQDNESGDHERMKTCWAIHAKMFKDDGKSSRILDELLRKHAAK